MRIFAGLGKAGHSTTNVKWIMSAMVCLSVAPHVTLLTLQHLNGVSAWLAELSRYVPYYWHLVPAMFAIGFTMLLSVGWVST